METECEVIFFGNIDAVEKLIKLLDKARNSACLHMSDFTEIIKTMKPEYDKDSTSAPPTGHIVNYYDTKTHKGKGVSIMLSGVYNNIENTFNNIAKVFDLEFLYRLEDYTNMIFINNDIFHVEFQSRFLVYFDDTKVVAPSNEKIYEKFKSMEWEYFHCEEAVKEWFKDVVGIEYKSMDDLITCSYDLGFVVHKYDYKYYHI